MGGRRHAGFSVADVGTPTSPGLGTRLSRARDLAEIFELVKGSVRRTLGLDRGGFMLAFFRPSPRPDATPGAALAVDGNVICLNKALLDTLASENPEAFPCFAYFALLHEYLRCLGWRDERERLTAVLAVCRANLGPSHPATYMATALPEALGDKGLAFYAPPDSAASGLQMHPTFDYSNVTYIQ